MGIFEDILRAKRTLDYHCDQREAHIGYQAAPPPEDPPIPPVLGLAHERYDQIFGIPIQVTSHLPLVPDHKEDARRIVRHGLKDVLEWLGEPVGPAPGEQIHATLFSTDPLTNTRMLYCSQKFLVAIHKSFG